MGVYVGYDQPKSLGKNETGGKVSAPIWGEFMKKAILKYKDEPILMPTNIDMVKIDAETGLLPSINSSQIIFEAFISGTAPTKFDVKPNKKDQLDDLDGQIY